jgi:putative hemolysin
MRAMISSIILLFVAGVVACSAQQAPNKSPLRKSKRGAATRVLAANPASVNCIDNHGGSLQMQYKVDGNQWAVCTFPDGSACEEWALDRGECQPGEMLTFVTDCKEKHGIYQGHRIDTTKYDPDGGAIQGFYYTCQYACGRVCFEDDYYAGKC